MKILKRIYERLRGFRRDENGFVVMAVLSIFLMLFVLCMSIYAVGETARQRIRLQNACDAAAYSAAVVQADGLSRMATINRAMSWTYIHMTNLQMDYITYRWLRLISKRFKEDHSNAKRYHRWLVCGFEPKLGYWAILEFLVDAILSRVIGLNCNCDHAAEGVGWWCGRGPNKSHNIQFNGHRPKDAEGGKSSYDKLQDALEDLSDAMDSSNTSSGALEEGYVGSDDDIDSLDITSALVSEEYAEKIDGVNSEIAALDKNAPDYEQQRAKLEDKRDELMEDGMYDKYDLNDWWRTDKSKAKKLGEAMSKDKDLQKNITEALGQQTGMDYSPEDVADMYKQYAANADPSAADIENVSSPNVNTQWGDKYAELIDADKKMIQLMNTMYSAINVNMHSSMEETAKFVLTSSLRDPRLPLDKAFEGMSAYISIPNGLNPYMLDASGGERSDNMFAPLYNTEPNERMFLEWGSDEHSSDPLYEFFPIGGKAEGNNKGWGFDQWFVRAGKNPNGTFPTVVRTEGMPGIQRSYKDSNINETGAGAKLLGKYVSRGNHIANLHLEDMPEEEDEEEDEKKDKKKGSGFSFDIDSMGFGETGKMNSNFSSGDFGGGQLGDFITSLIGDLIKAVVDQLLGQLVDQFCDITPSSGNSQKGDDFFMMCSKVSNTTALYADYDWSSCKWLCLTKPKLVLTAIDYIVCHICTGKCKNKKIPCDLKETKHKTRVFKIELFKHKGYGHYGFPKVFCGSKPAFAFESFGLSETLAKYIILDMFAPIPIPEKISGANHGYMGSTMNFSGFNKPLKPIFGSGVGCHVDTSVSPCHGSKCVHDMAREDYRSCCCFLDGALTSWNFSGTTKETKKGEDEKDNEFAMVPTAGIINGHARIYGDDREVFDERYIGESCQPWILDRKYFAGLGTVVVGAAMKQKNPFVALFNFWGSEDKDAGNTILSAFDPPNGNYIWTMSAARAGVRRQRRAGEMDGQRMYQVVYDPSCDAENLSIVKPHYYVSGKGWVAGLPDESVEPKIVGGCVCDGNADAFGQMWNLCEQDWDATLLPLRYCGRSASGSGDSWTWEEASGGNDVGNVNPLNPANQNKSWNPLGAEDGDLKLESLMPDGKSRLRLQNLLKANRIL